MRRINFYAKENDEKILSKLEEAYPGMGQQELIRMALLEWWNVRQDGNGKSARLERIESKIDRLIGD